MHETGCTCFFELSHFDGYFHLFAAANLAWAGSHRFREEIDNQVLKSFLFNAKKTIETEKGEIYSAFGSDIIKQSELDNKAKYIQNRFTQKLKKIEKEKNEISEFVNGYKSMFLLTGLFSVILLLLGGYQEFFPQKHIADILLVLDISLLFNVYVFYRGFTKNSNKFIPRWQIILLILSLGILITVLPAQYHFFDLEHHHTQSLYCITIAILIAPSPFIFHLITALYYNYIFNQRIKGLVMLTKAQLERIGLGEFSSDDKDDQIDL